jgi:predicted TIM-barrel fold metal-dependent hydrolase
MVTLIDVHRHLWSYDWFPPSHLGRNEAPPRSHPGRTREELLERIKQSPVQDGTGKYALEEMEHYGIDHAVILALDWGMAYGPTEDNRLNVEEFHRKTGEVAASSGGRLSWFAGVDPRRPRAVAIFEDMVKNHGAVGLKVYPPNGYQANDERCFPMYEKAIELDVPVLIHTGGNVWAWPEWVELVARRYPELRIMMGHVNLQAPFETGAYWDGLMAARDKRNVWLDICDWQVLGAMKDENIPQLMKVLRVFFDSMGPERVVWGTDLPMVGSRPRALTERWVDMAKNLPEWGAKHGVTFTEEERDGLCNGAARQVLSNVKLPA